MEDISDESGYSKSTVQRIFKNYLDHPPVHKIIPNNNCILLLDGTWFEKRNCLMVYCDIVEGNILYWRYTTGERSEEIEADLRYLKDNGVNVIAAISDGGRGILKSLADVYPDIPKQRCLVHIQRMAMLWLTKRPKTTAGKTLRALCLTVNRIRCQEDAALWTETFFRWDKEYKDFLNERSYAPNGRWWYTHKYIRRTRRMIIGALPDMFHYLDIPDLPKDTNRIDGGIFSDLKEHYRRHRGIPGYKRERFLNAYQGAD